jgi:hypothetical protein
MVCNNPDPSLSCAWRRFQGLRRSQQIAKMKIEAYAKSYTLDLAHACRVSFDLSHSSEFRLHRVDAKFEYIQNGLSPAYFHVLLMIEGMKKTKVPSETSNFGM